MGSIPSLVYWERRIRFSRKLIFFLSFSFSSARKTIKIFLYAGFVLLRQYWEIEQVTYPNMMEFFESLGVDMEASDMSLSVSLDNGQGCEWGSRNGLSSLFAQKKNVLNPPFWQMIREIIKFKHDVLRQAILFQTWDMIFCFWRRKIYDSTFKNVLRERNGDGDKADSLYIYCSYLDVLENNPDIDRNETLGQFINSRGYSELFKEAYLVRLLFHCTLLHP